MNNRPGWTTMANAVPALVVLAGLTSGAAFADDFQREFPVVDPACTRSSLAESSDQGNQAAWQRLTTAIGQTSPDSDAARLLVPELINAVEAADAPPELRQRAALMLGRIGVPAESAVPVLVRLIQAADRDGQAVSDAALPSHWSLKALGLFRQVAAPAVSTLAPLLAQRDRSLADRILLADVLGQIGSGPAIESLTSELLRAQAESGMEADAPAALLRKMLIESLALNGPRAASALPAFVRSLNDPGAEVRRAACDAISALGPRGEPALDALTERLVLDDDAHTRDSAAMALGSIGSEALPLLIRLLETDDRELQRRAASSLGIMTPRPDPVPAALLKAMSAQDAGVRIEAIAAVWKVTRDGKKVMEPLLRELSAPDRQIRRRASVLLLNLPEWPERLARSLEMLADQTDDAGRAAAWVLRERRRQAD